MNTAKRASNTNLTSPVTRSTNVEKLQVFHVPFALKCFILNTDCTPTWEGVIPSDSILNALLTYRIAVFPTLHCSVTAVCMCIKFKVLHVLYLFFRSFMIIFVHYFLLMYVGTYKIFVLDRRFVCQACKKSYKHKHHLTSHLRYECGKEPRFECPFCYKMCHHRYVLNAHVRQCHLLVQNVKQL